MIETETPVINQAGIALSNRIRFLYDPKGLTLPQKLGGWIRFLATQITNGVVRALWPWQDTNGNQWLAYATDNATDSQLWAVQCTVDTGSGLTSATGTPQLLSPTIVSSNAPTKVSTSAGLNTYVIQDPGLVVGGGTQLWTVYITTPISVGGVVLQGVYPVVTGSATLLNSYSILAYDILGNSLNALYTNTAYQSAVPFTNVTFTNAVPSNRLNFTFGTGVPLVPGGHVNIQVADNSITGTYIVLATPAPTATTFSVATTLTSYTWTSTGDWNTAGTTPQFYTTSGSNSVTVIMPDHGFSAGSYFYVLNPTLVGGITIQGSYPVQTIPNSYTFTILTPSAATSTDNQYQGAVPVTGGTGSGSSVTLNYPATPFTHSLTIAPAAAELTSGVNPTAWNGWHTVTASTGTSVTYANSTAGSWVLGGSVAPLGGAVGYIYSSNATPTPTSGPPGGFWTLDNWGNDLVAVSSDTPVLAYPNFTVPYQPIWIWDATGPTPATALQFGPPASNGAFVAMPERQIIAWGSSFSGVIDPLLIRWCDINNFNTWVAQTTNQAGSFRLPSGAEIIGARQTPQQALIWTDIEVWAMQYINQPYVYGFNKIGQGCGLIGRYAHGVLGGITYWMSKTQFFMLNGDGVVSIPCPIWDVVFQDLDLVNADKITCAPNSMFQEIAWYFPVKSGNGENSQYIKLNVAGLAAGQGPIWDFGTLDRSAWIDVSVLQQPIGFSPLNEYIYQHEISPDADGAAMGESFTTGWFALDEGDVMPFVDQVWPDCIWGYYGQAQNASVTFTISGQDFPGQTAQTVGPYTINKSTTYISPRIRHRLLSFTVSGTGTGTWWRLGGIRYRFQPDGKY